MLGGCAGLAEPHGESGTARGRRGSTWLRAVTAIVSEAGDVPALLPLLPWAFHPSSHDQAPREYGSQGVWLRGRGAGGVSGRTRVAGKLCGSSTAQQPGSNLTPSPRPIVTSGGATPAMPRAEPEPERAPGSGPSVGGGAGSVVRRPGVFGLYSLVGPPRNRSRLLSLVTVGGERLPGGLQGLIFPLHLHRGG